MTDTPHTTTAPPAAIDSATPTYVHHLLDAYLTGRPLNFHGAPVPLDVQRRLEHAAATGQMGPVPADETTAQYVMVAVARLPQPQPNSEATR